MYKRPSARPSRGPRAQSEAPYVPVNRGPPPSWVTNKKYTVTAGNNRWKTYTHDNRRTGLRTQVRVAPGETLTNVWRMDGFPDPVPAPGRFAMLEEGEILTRTLPMPRMRAPAPPPRRLLTLPPTPRVNNQNAKNKAYIKGLVTRIIHKITEPNYENRKYIARLVGGIISKIKRANSNAKVSLSAKNNATSRKRTNTGAFMGEMLRNKAGKKAYGIQKGYSNAQVNALLRSGLVNEENLNNALRAVRAAQQQTQKPVNVPLRQTPALRTYADPERAPGLVLNKTLQHLEGAIGSGNVVMRAPKPKANRARAPIMSLSKYTVVPESIVEPKKKKVNNSRSRLAKKLKKF